MPQVVNLIFQKTNLPVMPPTVAMPLEPQARFNFFLYNLGVIYFANIIMND